MDALIYSLLALTSVVGLTFIVERSLALRWGKVVPPAIVAALAACRTRSDVEVLRRVCAQKPSALGRLLTLGADQLDWPKADNVDALQSAARHEIVRLERGIVVLEIIVGIAPLLGLVGTIAGMITVFGDLGQTGLNDAAKLAQGIALILRATLIGLLIAIPALIAWSYFSKKVEVLAVEMEALCDDFIRRQYADAAIVREKTIESVTSIKSESASDVNDVSSQKLPDAKSVLFTKRAAIYSVVAPLICLVNGALTRHLQHSNVIAGLIIALISVSLVTSGLILGIKAFISCKRNNLKGVFGWAITGICLNGIIISVMVIGILALIIIGLQTPT